MKPKKLKYIGIKSRSWSGSWLKSWSWFMCLPWFRSWHYLIKSKSWIKSWACPRLWRKE